MRLNADYLDNNGGKSDVEDANTYDDWHTYEIDWTHDAISWSVDGDVKRTLEKKTTWNETAQRYQFPQTPSRMQLSLWPAGQSSNAEGTIEWAGGEIDWDSEDIKNDGYYAATVGEINVTCYGPPGGTDNHGNKSYIFTDDKGLNTSVQMTNNDTVIASFGATGLDMDIGADKDDSDSSSDDSTVPESKGGSGNEPGSSDLRDPDQKNVTSTSAASKHERVMQGSLFAALVAVVVLIIM